MTSATNEPEQPALPADPSELEDPFFSDEPLTCPLQKGGPSGWDDDYCEACQ